MQEHKKNAALSELSDAQIYLKLFWITLTLSASTFGGGFVIISMMKKKMVEELGWLEEEEMLDMTAIAQSSPGPLGVNIAIVAGYRIKRFMGALVSTIGAVIPPLVIISVISIFYNQFKDNTYIAIALQAMRAGVAAVICDVVINLAQNILKTKKVLWVLMMTGAFVAACLFHVSAIVIILVCGTIGLIQIFLSGKKEDAR